MLHAMMTASKVKNHCWPGEQRMRTVLRVWTPKSNSTIRTPMIRALSVVLFALSTWTSVSLSACQPDVSMKAINPNIGPPFQIDMQLAADQGIQRVVGQHLELYSDLKDLKQLKNLVAAFDEAVPLWCKIYGVPSKRARNWKMRGFLIASPATLPRFQDAKLMDTAPSFDAGFQQDHNFWFYAQPGPYYSRHLMLHEGTHAFSQWFTGGYGAPWYSEGMAELVGLHRWNSKAQPPLQLNYRLTDKSEAEYWGRVKRIRTNLAEGKSMTLDDVLNIPAGAFRSVRYYAWSWAACEFFSRHPKTSTTFASLLSQTQMEPGVFNKKFKDRLEQAGVNWERLGDQWELFLDEIDYGYLVENSILRPASSLNAKTFAIRSDQSWQMLVRVKKGQKWQLSANGKFSLGKLALPKRVDGKITLEMFSLSSEANGITAYHYRERPLGELQAAVWATNESDSRARTQQLRQPVPIGLSRVFEIDRDGILCLRINESPAKLADNQHALEVSAKQLE